MKRLQVLCAEKGNQGASLEVIIRVGGVNGTGEKWVLSVQDAIAGIDAKQWEFYINREREEIPVNIHFLNELEKSLMATRDGSTHNLLEELIECP